VARAALQEQQPGQLLVPLARGDHLAGEQGELLAAGVGVVERHLDLVLGQDQAGQPVGGATHAPTVGPRLVVLAGCGG
jgi:hypothetical protein